MSIHRFVTITAAVLAFAGTAGAADWRVPGDFPTIQDAIDSASVVDGDAIVVEAGNRAGATVTKALSIRARGKVQIVDGPAVTPSAKAGFYFPGGGQGSGSSITGFTFTGIPLPVFSRGADDVSVSGNTMSSFLQGVTSWGYGSWGNRWEISGNTMTSLSTSCGGGIGVLVGDFQGGTVSGNLVTRNLMRGRLRVPDGDCGGYNAPGIVLYADFRGGAAGALIQANVVSRNKVAVASPTSVVGAQSIVVSVSGVELTDTRGDWAIQPPVVTDNAVTYNDLRGMALPITSMPDEVASVNTIENNYTSIPGFGDRPSVSRTPFSKTSLERTPRLAGPLPIR
jgi:hypothetical protein